MKLTCGQREVDLSTPKVMGILNITPDSFSDGGQLYQNLDACLTRAEQMCADGVHFLDVGGESTRPGAEPVSEAEELDRVIPVVEALVSRFDCVVSVDTSTASVIRESAKCGAGFINDVRALTREGALNAASESQLPVCLMHMRGDDPRTMQSKACYSNVVSEVRHYLGERMQVCKAAGISHEKIICDPGIGFGKSDEHNLALMAGLADLKSLQVPLLLGVSRKSLIGRLFKREVSERLAASLAFAYACLAEGASILRVHDVAETLDVVKAFNLILEARK
jgi:dihydropteroate synthase